MRILMTLCMMATVVSWAYPDDWWNTDWQYRHRIHLNASILDDDLSGVPLHVELMGDLAPGANATKDGRDVRAVDTEGQLLPVEVVQWTPERGEVHIKAPRIVAGKGGQYVDLYYGNPQAEAVTGAVWDDAYRFVLHFQGNLADATGHDQVVTSNGVAPVSGHAAVFTSDPSHFEVAPALLEGLGDTITLAVRFRAKENPPLQTLVSGMDAEGKNWFNFGLKLPGIVHTNAVSQGKTAPELNVAGITPDTPHAAVVRYDAKNRTRTIAVDGVIIQQDSALPGSLPITAMRLGRGVLHFEPWQFLGQLEEVRLADVARSNAWMLVESATLSDGGLFSVVGARQERGAPLPPPRPAALVEPEEGLMWRRRAPITLTWRPAAGAENYAVLLYAAPDAARPSEEFDAGNSTRFTLPESIRKESVYWTVVAKSSTGATESPERRRLDFYDWSETMLIPPDMKATPALSPVKDFASKLSGYLQARVSKVVDNWFLEVPESSPAILQVFRDRDKRPVREPLVPWAGEFAGKFLTSAQLTWRVERDPRLKQAIDEFVRELIACQDEYGYLGPFPAESRLTGGNWDVWGHYHCMLGLLLYYEDTGYEPALAACRKMADLLFETFGSGGPSLTCDGGQGQMNMAVCHGLLLLYRKTGEPRYLDLANYIVHEAWNEPNAGQYLTSALAGKEVWEFPAHRWEALHDYQALPQLYWLTGNEDYRKAFEHIWWSIAKGDRHNTGGFSSGEGCTGSPYNLGAIETCCTVAWIALSVDMLRLTGDPRVADELEWSTLNSALGALPFSGRACAYNVPMDGTRTFGVELPWQAPKAGPDLNCCSVNAPRPLGMLSEWALMQAEDGLALNYYGPGTLAASLHSGNRIRFEQVTDYPVRPTVRIRLSLDTPEQFALKIRIPRWSATTTVDVNGVATDECVPGTYQVLDRTWNTGDDILVTFDFATRIWAGEQEAAGTVSVYRGPLLFAYDARFNDLNPDELPKIDPSDITLTDLPHEGALAPWVLATLTSNGASFTVCDLASAGQTGNHYRSWLPADKLPPSPFHLEKGAGATLKWSARAGAERWKVSIATDRAFTQPMVMETKEPEVTPKLEPGRYYWTVTAINAHGQTDAANGPWELVIQ